MERFAASQGCISRDSGARASMPKIHACPIRCAVLSLAIFLRHARRQVVSDVKSKLILTTAISAFLA